MKKKHIEKKKLSKECWNLDITFLKWLEIHLKTYLKDASKIVDLTYHKFTINDKEYTQKEAIEKMLYNLNLVNRMSNLDEGYTDLVDEILDIWKVVFHSMWW